ncbi:MAG: hypothetical protein ACE5Z5_04555 [Candidatus Bathyarchaeia archaeon]
MSAVGVHEDVAKYNVPLYTSLYQLHRQLRQRDTPSALEHAIKTVLFLLFKKLLADLPSRRINNIFILE